MSVMDRLRGRRRRNLPAEPTALPPSGLPVPAAEQGVTAKPLSVGLQDSEASGWRNRSAGELLAGFDAFPDAVILDAGCGDAPHAAFFADQDVEIIVADIVPEFVTAAARAVARAGSVARVRELVTDVDPLPLPDASVDRVVATEVLEHVPDPKGFLAELVRVGKPGARYLLAVPDSRSEMLQAPFAAPDYFEPPNHLRVYSDEEFDALIRDSGLEIQHKQYDGFYHSLWWSFFWVSAQPELREPWHPVLASWMQTWQELLQLDRGPQLKLALDGLVPKSQVVVARKPGP